MTDTQSWILIVEVGVLAVVSLVGFLKRQIDANRWRGYYLRWKISVAAGRTVTATAPLVISGKPRIRILSPEVSPKPDLDQQRLRPHLRVGSVAATPVGSTHSYSTSVGKDAQDMRGIPVIGRGVGGTSPGTNPESATIYRLTPRRQR